MWQAALEKGNDLEDNGVSSAEAQSHVSDQVESVASQINELAISSNPVNPPSNSTESSTTGDHLQEIDKKIRALKKKVYSLALMLQTLGTNDRVIQDCILLSLFFS